jgi:hypothetical protein
MLSATAMVTPLLSQVESVVEVVVRPANQDSTLDVAPASLRQARPSMRCGGEGSFKVDLLTKWDTSLCLAMRLES